MLAPSPLCPRCGYDQRGLSDTWMTQCPLVGTCSECGLEFEWVDVWRPDREQVEGLFEHARRARHFVWWPLRTFWLTMRPWAFWSRVRLSMRPRIGRLAVWAVVTTAELWILVSLLWMLTAWMRWGGTPFWPVAGVNYQYGSPFLGDKLCNAWLWPVFLVESWAGWPPFPGTTTITAERTDWPGALAVLVVAWGAWPVVFLALSDTLDVARVKWQHVFRATCYGLAFLPAMCIARLVAGSMNDPEGMVEFAGVALVLWIQVWWLCACRLGFRLPVSVGVVLCFVSLLAAIVAVFVAGATGYHMRYL